jgi:LuxR family quorum sensing-dependent transcriptional regulator
MDAASEFNLRLRRCETPTECTELFRDAIAEFGLHTFAVGELDLAVRERTVIYIQDWPDDWRSFYLGTAFVHRDPVVDALVDRWEPFTWTELRTRRSFDLGPQGQGLASSFGWSEGLAVPLGRGQNRIGVVSMAGRVGQLDRSAIDYLTLIGTCLHSHVRTLLGRYGIADSFAGLTQREMDCLRLVALGLTDAEIARDLAIAISTAHEHVENAKRKLCTKSRAEAAAVAASLGIVDM